MHFALSSSIEHQMLTEKEKKNTCRKTHMKASFVREERRGGGEFKAAHSAKLP